MHECAHICCDHYTFVQIAPTSFTEIGGVLVRVDREYDGSPLSIGEPHAISQSNLPAIRVSHRESPIRVSVLENRHSSLPNQIPVADSLQMDCCCSKSTCARGRWVKTVYLRGMDAAEFE